MRWMKKREYQALPTNTSPSSSPNLSSGRPRFSRRRVHIAILVLTAVTILFVGWHTPTRDRVGEYAQYGKEVATSWTGDGLKQKYWLERMDEWKGKCKGWDPEKPEEEDPEFCLKAKQYRQTMRVLEREEKAKQ
jgi:hypothetical protein